MLDKSINDVLADLVDADAEWREYLHFLLASLPAVSAAILCPGGKTLWGGEKCALPPDIENRLIEQVVGEEPVRLDLSGDGALYGMRLASPDVYLLVIFSGTLQGAMQEEWFTRFLHNAITGFKLKLEMQDRQLENQQLVREIEALKSQHTKLLEDNYSQYLLLQEKEKQYSRKLEQEIAKKTASLKEANVRLQEASRLKSEFLANMSHELRTPMNAIIGFAHLLEETELDSEQEDYIKTINNAADSLLVLINGILDLAKIEAGKMEVEQQPFSLAEVVESIVSLFVVATRGKNVALRCEIDPALPAQVVGDANRLRQILVNLIGNAVKFTAEGHVAICAKLARNEEARHWISFSVQDTGIGIPAERQRVIFEKFTQADGSTTRRYGGTGLGLAICHQLVKLLGGEIELASEFGKGSEFTFTLPFAIVEKEKPLTRVSTAGEAVEPAGEEIVEPLNVLLVEDNPVNQKLAAILLGKESCTVRLAGDGNEALELLKTEEFDLVLMDVQMPNMDGIEATRRIRRIEKDRKLAASYKGLAGRATPLVIVGLTAHARRQDQQECLDAGMDDFLTKPIERPRLVAVLHKQMARVRQGRSRGSGEC